MFFSYLAGNGQTEPMTASAAPTTEKRFEEMIQIGIRHAGATILNTNL